MNNRSQLFFCPDHTSPLEHMFLFILYYYIIYVFFGIEKTLEFFLGKIKT